MVIGERIFLILIVALVVYISWLTLFKKFGIKVEENDEFEDENDNQNNK